MNNLFMKKVTHFYDGFRTQVKPGFSMDADCLDNESRLKNVFAAANVNPLFRAVMNILRERQAIV